jgi:hypothetical protein
MCPGRKVEIVGINGFPARLIGVIMEWLAGYIQKESRG